MKFEEAMQAIRQGARVEVPVMPGCEIFVGPDENGEPTICMQSPNGKLVRNWLPPALLSADWSVKQ